jgi:eukaryotic-like serine/threonine-protein kinase
VLPDQHTTGEPRVIGQRYQLQDQIGRGGMATVFRAHDVQLDREVAVKIMRPDLGDDAQFVVRFEAEARRAASVTHPNVVSVYDVGTDGSPYMVMELVRGGDVATALASDGRLDPRRAAELAADTAGALQAAHDAGLVHRDVKPGNILLAADGRARVADFGIARATGEDGLTRTGATLGSVEYFSPEQARGEPVTPASDVYALGVVLYEMLTGRRPFVGDSPYAVATARLGQPAPDPRGVVPDLPAELAEITMRAMALEPSERFESAGAMRRQLVTWLEGAGTGEAAPGGGFAAAPVRAAPPITDTQPRELAPVRDEEPRTPVQVAPGPTLQPEPRRPEPRTSRRARAVPALLFLLALLGAGYIGGELLLREVAGPSEAPAIIAGSADGGVLATATPVATQTVEATATPVETPAPSPTATPQPVRRPAVIARTPSDAIAAFYSAVEDGRFDDAYALWSDRMKRTYSRQSNLDGRFEDTADIRFTELRVAEQSSTAATVQANFVETYDSGSSREFVGYWELVRVDGRWLLDAPTY